ncbi:MarR family winged helix-turn-helix transcriptional regulator [Xanthovirga aplysinae]|uniref:MarR family winged helix-turn-helix transcriptional regulator n=1 Tax=Xanthovirga aplysinae TaxID=2529853 RepID=UPI0012BBBC46|nr:MarR family transcriptional regulator [Xanthovirga aplysinae]MTI31494.1 MarR family transcriptional regulator [Xanthovirga aplysinae]
MTLYRQLGELLFGTRLKRLSDKFLTDVSKIYQSQGIKFEPSWFPIFFLLDKKQKSTLKTLAEELEVSHSAISQMVNTLEKKELLKVVVDEEDKRQKWITFSPKGRDILERVKPIWIALEDAMKELFSMGKNSPVLLSALEEVEDAMEEQFIFSKVTEKLNSEI